MKTPNDDALHAPSLLAVGLAVLIVATGCGSPQQSAPAAPAPPSPPVVHFQGMTLPELVFKPTHYKYPDEPMQSYQDSVNGTGALLSKAYTAVRTALVDAELHPELRSDTQWRQRIADSLSDLRKREDYLGKPPVSPSRASKEVAEFYPVVRLSASIADTIDNSIQSDNSEYKTTVPNDVTALAKVIQKAQGRATGY